MDTSPTDPKDLSNLLGLDELNEAERADFIDDIGGVIIESAVLNFLLTLSEAEHVAFQEFLATAGAGEELLEAIATKYPSFLDVLEVEIAKFRGEAAAVLGD